MKTWKKELLKEWWNNNLDYLPLGAKWRGLWQKGAVTGIIKELDERKLDIAIAQRIFGYEINVGERTEYQEYGGQIEIPELQMCIEVHKNGSWDGSDWKEWEAIPHYSTDLNEAWKIVSYLQSKDFRFCLDGSYSSEYEAAFYAGDSNCSHNKKYDPTDGHGFTSVEADGKTPAEAICNSALKL